VPVMMKIQASTAMVHLTTAWNMEAQLLKVQLKDQESQSIPFEKSPQAMTRSHIKVIVKKGQRFKSSIESNHYKIQTQKVKFQALYVHSFKQET